jgi:hypothetical protein
MNFKKSALASAITLATFATGAAAFDASSWEVSGYFKNETAALQKDGTFVGQVPKSTATDYTADHVDQGDVIKFENTLKLFVNGALGENADLHAELNLVFDSEAEDSDHESHESYTQNDFLRELYVDSVFGENSDVELRVGKQQVVWGTADGAKLLDIINPTDYREMAQNTMEDSRIPVWMAKIEAPAGDSGTFQAVLYQPRENVFAGLNRNISTTRRSNGALSGAGELAFSYQGDVQTLGQDRDNPFVLKGVDSITGQVNGFLNIAPDLGTVASLFGRAFSLNDGTAETSVAGLSPSAVSAMQTALGGPAVAGFLVGTFNTTGSTLSDFSTSLANATDSTGDITDGTNDGTTFSDIHFGDSAFYAGGAGSVVTGQGALAGFASMFSTNLLNTDSAINSTFELMDRTSFATFDAFVGATSEYVYDMPDDLDMNLAFRFKDSLENGLGYSVNYAYAYDHNPIVTVDWRDSSGNKLTVNRGTEFAAVSGAVYSSVLTLSGPNANGYGGYASENGGETAVLRFTQTAERAHNVGGAFDYTIDSEKLGGVVLRGEFLYQKDVYSPVVDRGALAIGDLPAALTMRKGDRFKYVLGADITVLTNMLVSGQFIQDRNLDYIDNNVDFNGSACSASRYLNAENCGVYTADFAAMHLENGLQKARENKEFYSLFLSKPFGPNQLGRWNNITMYEEGDGWWNRFDVEYSFTDELVGTFELNNYWGDANTQFGQLEDASNVQVGFKYLF